MIVKKYETLLKNYGGNCKCALINPAKYMKGQLYEIQQVLPHLFAIITVLVYN